MGRLYCFAISFIIMFVFGFLLFDYDTLYRFYAEKAYFFPFFSVLIWFQMIAQMYEPNRFKNFIKNHKIALILSIFIVSSIYTSFKPQPKFLPDELHYASFAKSMYEDHTVYNVYEEESMYPGIKKCIASDLGGRTLVYPFFVSVFHTFLRCNYHNHYIMNFIVSILCLFGIYYFVYLFYGKKYGILAIMVCLTYPIFVQYATSSSIEIFNLLFFLLLIVFGYKLCFTRDVYVAEFLIYSCLLYINIKQNNIFIFIVLCIFVALVLKEKTKYFSYRISVLPIFIIPYLWMNSLLEGANQKSQNLLENMATNLKNAFILLFGANEEYGWKILPNALFVLLPIILIWHFIKLRKKFEKTEGEINLRKFAAYLFVIYSFVLIDNFSAFNSIVSLNYVSRACFVLVPLFVFVIVFIYKFFVDNTSINKKMLAVFTAMLMFYNLSYGVTGKGIEREYSFKEIRKVLRFLESDYPYKDEFLLVSPFPGYFVPYGYDSISIRSFNQYHEAVIAKKKRNLGTNIIILQDLKQGNILPNSVLEPDQKLIPVCENSIVDGRTVRLSLVDLKQ